LAVVATLSKGYDLDYIWKQVNRGPAATSTYRAERIASSIVHPASKAAALTYVAEVLAATDPDRAAGLLADAKQVASSITRRSSCCRMRTPAPYTAQAASGESEATASARSCQRRPSVNSPSDSQ
jgi:hypothetical protein